MLLNFIVGVLLLIRVSVYVPGDNKYVALANERLGEVFSPDWDGSANTLVNIYSFQDLTDFMSDSYVSFEALPNDELGTWQVTQNQTMVVRYLTPPHSYKDILLDPSLHIKEQTLICDIDAENPLGPFSTLVGPVSATGGCTGIDEIQWKVNSAEVRFTVESIRQLSNLLTPVCYRWDITQSYDFKKAGVIKFSLTVDQSLCGLAGVDDGFGATMDYLSIFLLLFSIWGMLLRAKSVRRIYKLQRILQRKQSTSGRTSAYTLHVIDGNSPCSGMDFDEQSTVSSSSSTATRKEFLTEALDLMTTNTQTRKGYSWLVAGIIGDVCVIASSICDLYIYHTSSDVGNAALVAANAFLGMASFIQWSVFVTHLGDQPWLFLLISSLRKGTPIAFRFMAGCLPFYLGYALMGTHIFGPNCFRFITVDRSAVSLFAVLNGDVVHQTFSDMFPDQNTWAQFFSRAYLYSFIILFIYVILNIFLAIMEDTYFQIKQALISDLQDDLKK
eukprot:TRINITY_DN6603_c0_g2_i1.p1 TRINITY_DN6603_c0_g2~~TRINITY_DN6603_c0_g2_i1.p1  ORF type:complete len:545 (+),score=91.85 TRINITY_DN6603_c0_g2_i1:136-1635(+)